MEAKIGAIVLAAVAGVAMICLTILTAVHDGSMAQTAAGLFTQVIQTALYGLAGLLGVGKVVEGVVSVKQTQATLTPPQGVPAYAPPADTTPQAQG